MTNREWMVEQAAGDKLVLWAIDHCDEFEVEQSLSEWEWIRFRFGDAWYHWNSDDYWDGGGEEVAMLMVQKVERERDELHQSLRDVRRVLAERLEEVGSVVANEIMDVLHESAWMK